MERRETEKGGEGGKVYIHVIVPRPLYDLLAEYCRKRGLKKGEVVRRALDEFFSRERERGNI